MKCFVRLILISFAYISKVECASTGKFAVRQTIWSKIIELLEDSK